MIARYTQPGPWADVIALPGRFAAVSQVQGTTEIHCDAEVPGSTQTERVWSCLTAEPLLYLRAAALPSGHVLVVGQGNSSDTAQCVLVRPDGTAQLVLLNSHVVGVSGVAVEARGGYWYVVVLSGPRTWSDFVVSSDGAVIASGTHPVPVFDPSDPQAGMTSEGFLYARDEAPVWIPANRMLRLDDGRVISNPGRAGGAWAGLGGDAVFFGIGHAGGTLIFTPPEAKPHFYNAYIVQAGDRYAVCAWCQDLTFSWAVIAPPYPEPTPMPVDPELRQPKAAAAFTPVIGEAPLTITGTVTPAADSGAYNAVRFYAQQGSETPVRWGGPTGNDLTASGVLSQTGAWNVWARIQGKNDQVIDTLKLPVVVQQPAVVVSPVVVPPPAPIHIDPPQQRGLGAGNCTDLLGDVWMREIADHGVTLVRRDGCNKPTTAAQVDAVDAECWRVGIRPLYLGSLPLMELVPEGSWFEFWSGTPPRPGDTGGASVSGAQYAKEASVALDIAKRRNLRLFLGVLDNLNDAWLGKGQFLDQFIAGMGPRWAEVKDFSAHWYPNDYEDAGVGHDGRATTQADVDYLRSKIGPDRTVLFTEAGFHNAPRRVQVRLFGINLWKRTIRGLTELEVLARLQQFDQFCAQQKNVIGWCIYQLVDAKKTDPNTPINRYGLREAMDDGGRWKLQSTLWS